MLELLFLLLPVAAGYGWVMGRNSVRQAQRKQSKILSRHYYKGLNFLLSDQADKAVDPLIKMMNVDSDTAETHIAMGNLFRHRGELDRAIRVHQNLVDKQELGDEQRDDALKELGRDYMLAGFLERAESAYLQLLHSEKHYIDAQYQLFNIYQTTKEWHRAVSLAEDIIAQQGGNDELCKRIAHFYAELALIQIDQNDIAAAQKNLQKAIQADEHGVRPWLLLGQLAIKQAQYQQALEYLDQVALRDMTWLSEAVPQIEICADQLNDSSIIEKHLAGHWQQGATAYLAKVKLLLHQGKQTQATEYLEQQLHRAPTMKGFKTLMGLYSEQQSDDKAQHNLQMLQQLVEKQIAQRPKYRCTSCGFSGHRLYWLCPSCKKWGVIKPIKGLDGE